MEEDPKAGWNEWVKRAHDDRVDLSAHGYYSTPGIGFDWNKGKGNLYNYFCYGASCSEVEVDTLTGDFNVLRSDLLMDVGNSLNPAIDIGQVGLVMYLYYLSTCIPYMYMYMQVEGAFTQGLGLFTLEQCVYLEGNPRTPRGQPFTTGPGTYKIPSSSDIPLQLNVSLMDHTPNPKAIFSSKVMVAHFLGLFLYVLWSKLIDTKEQNSNIDSYLCTSRQWESHPFSWQPLYSLPSKRLLHRLEKRGE